MNVTRKESSDLPDPVSGVPDLAARATVKRTAAVPSLNRLSASTSMRNRPCTPASLKEAMTETGSVAEISTASRRAVCHPHPSRKWMPAAVSPATSNEDAQGRKRQDNRQIAPQLLPFHLKGGFKDKGRQGYGEDQLFGQDKGHWPGVKNAQIPTPASTNPTV